MGQEEAEGEGAEEAAGVAEETTPGQSNEKPQQGGGPALIFLGVGRVKDKVVFATHTPLEEQTKAQEAEKILRKLLVKAQAGTNSMPPGERDYIAWDHGKIGYFLDAHGEYLACVATSTKTYPQPAVFNLLTDFLKAVSASDAAKTAGKHKLNVEMLPRIQELFAQYENPGKSSAY